MNARLWTSLWSGSERRRQGEVIYYESLCSDSPHEQTSINSQTKENRNIVLIHELIPITSTFLYAHTLAPMATLTPPPPA